MIVHFDQHWLYSVPAALRARRATEHDEHLRATYNITTFDSAPDTVRIDISRSTPAKVYAYLEADGAVACDIEAADVPVWIGRSPVSYACLQYVETHPHEFQRLTPDEIADRLQHLSRLMTDGGGEVTENDEFLAEIMLRNAGYDLPPAVDLDYRPAIDHTAADNAWDRKHGFDHEDRDIQNAWRPSMPDDDFLL